MKKIAPFASIFALFAGLILLAASTGDAINFARWRGGFQPETVRYAQLPGASTTPAALATIDAYVRAVKSGETVTLAPVTGYLSRAAGYYFPTGLSTDLRWASLISGAVVTFAAAGQTAAFGGTLTAGAGETYSSNLVTNGANFTGGPPPTGWNEADVTARAVAGGNPGNCMEITLTANTLGMASYTKFSTTSGALYRWSYDLLKGTQTGARMLMYDNQSTYVKSVDITLPAAWGSYSQYYTALPSGYSNIAVQMLSGVTGLAMTTDNHVYAKVLTPDATAFTATTLTDSGINPNTGTYTVTITRP